MSSDGIPKEEKRRFPALVLILVIIAVFTAVAIFLIISHIIGPSFLSDIFSPRLQEITAEEFSFDIGRAKMFASFDNSIAAAGTLGIKVLGTDGIETLRDSFRMNQPAIANSENYYIAFDIGGSSVRIFTGTHVISSLEANGTVVSASVNKNGWFCVVTQDGGGYRGVVTVYNHYGSDVFRAHIGSGFVLSAELSPDNKHLAILSFTETGSRITFYDNIDSEDEPTYRFDYSGGLIIDFTHLSNGEILAVSADLLFTVDSQGNRNVLYSYHDNRLGGYAYDNDFIALHLYDYGIGYQGRLVALLADGTILGEVSLEREVLSISAAGQSFVILKTDGVAFFTNELDEYSMTAESLSAAGANRILALRGDVALATSDNSAVILRREEEH